MVTHHRRGFGPAGVIFCAFFTFAAIACAGTYSGGSGTVADPYKISTVADWQELTQDPNNWDKQFILLHDIDLAGIAVTPVAPDSDTTKTGYQGTPFTGIIEGAGHALLNVVINLPTYDYVGIFGYVKTPGVIRNLGVENATITGRNYIGAVTALSSGTLLHCHASGQATGSNGVGMLAGGQSGVIDRCFTSGTVNGSFAGIGMLIGVNAINGVVQRCYATGEVDASDCISVGGLIGVNRGGSIVSCYSVTAVTGLSWVGGLIGQNDSGVVDSCYATGVVTGPGTVGGLIGLNDTPVLSCFWNIESSGQVGSSGGKGLTHSQMKTMTIFQNAGWADKDWIMQDGFNSPRLAWEESPGVGIPAATAVPLRGSGTELDPYQIWTVEDWVQLSWYQSLLDQHLSLMVDLDLAGVEFGPIGDLGPFTGVFDGKGHVIRNAEMNMGTSDDVGLFRSVGPVGRIQNLTLEGGWIRGREHVGSLVGFNNGTIIRCSAAGKVEGGTYYQCTGGLIGRNEGTVIQCSMRGIVSGDTRIGGLIGWSYSGVVRDCYSMTDVTGNTLVGGFTGINGGTLQYCYSQGSVTGISKYGGFVGSYDGIPPARITSCFWDITTSGKTYSAGGVGKTTVEMKTQATFTGAGWDCVGETANGTADVWRMCADGISYPRLSWEFSVGGDFNCPDGVATEDLLYLAQRWMKTTAVGAADGNGDGKVDLVDLAMVSENWMR
jgi:hypothetical protein